jgi:hypothetical protein
MDEIACKKINKYMSKNLKNALFSFVLYDNHNSYGTALSYPQYHRKPFSDEDPSISIMEARFKEKEQKIEFFRKSDFKTISFKKN